MRYHFGLFRRFLSVLFAAVLLFFFASPFVSAAVLPSGAFIVSPVKQELSMKPGESKTVTLTLSNGTQFPLLVTGSYQDIASSVQATPVDEPVKLVAPDGKSDSLSLVMDFPKKSFDLLSGKQIQVPVTITLPKSAQPGGRYGSVVWTFKVGNNTSGSAPANVAVESRIAALFYLRVEGEVEEEGGLVTFGLFNDATRAEQPGSSTPLRFQLSYENKGNVHLDPYGRITVTGMLSDPKVLVVDPWAVLPGATRMREVDLFSPLLPGYYHAHLELNRGYKDIVDERDVAFWVMPSIIEWVVGIILLILLILLIRRSLSLSRHSV